MANETTQKQVFNTYQYTLHLYETIENPDKKLDTLILNPTDKATVKIGSTDYTLTLQGVKFTRKIYEPGLIEAEVSIAPVASVEDVRNMFMMRRAVLTIRNTDSNATENQKKEQIIARNYYVFMVNPQIVMNKGVPSLFVKLTIYSMDKLMTLDKYSKAYVAKKLGSGILEPESHSFGFKSVMFGVNTENLRHLRYPMTSIMKDLDNKDVTVKINSEFIQPYLVQYNETFYDFMVRTANRCGEFFYFEDGELILGLPETKSAEIIPTYSNLTFQGISDSPLTIGAFARDSIKDDKGEMEKLNFEAIEKDKAGFPKDSFPTGVSYNAELANDEYIYPLYKDKWTTLLRETSFEKISDLPIPLVFSIMKNEFKNVKTDGVANAIDFIIAFGTEWAKLGFFSMMAVSSVDGVGNKSFLDPLNDKNEQHDDSHGVPFAPLKDEGWTKLDYYTDIRKYEEQQQKGIICIDMGTNYVPVKLGEKIRVEGLSDTYIVIQVSQVSDLVWTRNYKKFDPNNTSTDLYSKKQSQVILAIPTYKDNEGNETAIPPVMPVSITRKAGPQTAFVTDNNDPKYQGRVRIAYPWQSANEGKRLELYQAEDELKEAEQNANNAQNKLTEMRQALLNLRAQKTELEALRGKSEEEKQAKKAEIDIELQEIDQKIQKIQLPEIKKDSPISPADYAMRLAQQAELKRLENRKKVLTALKNILDGNTDDIDSIIKTIDKEVDNQEKKGLKDAKDAVVKAQKKKDEKEKTVNEKAEDVKSDLQTISSPWIRVSSPLATEGGGAYFKPQVGDEVLVNYDNNNVERPYVMGGLFSKNVLDPDERLNRTHTASDLLKGATATIMSANGHHIILKDEPDGKAFMTKIQPALGALTGVFNTSCMKDTGGGIHIGDRYGIYELSLSSHDRKINISSPMGDVNIDAYSGITITAPNGDVSITGKNVKISAGNNLELTSGLNIQYPVEGHPKKRYKAANALKGIIVGAASAGIGSMVATYVDLSFVRVVVETFLRPIEGTMCVKSKRYLMLEAGKGKAHIAQNRYGAKEKDAIKEEQDFFNNLMDCVEHIDSRLSDFSENYKKMYNLAHEQRKVFDRFVDALIKDNCAEKKDLFKNVIKKAKDAANRKAANKKEKWKNPVEKQMFEGKIVSGLVVMEGGLMFHSNREKLDKLTSVGNKLAKAVYNLCAYIQVFGNTIQEKVHQPAVEPMDTLLVKAFEDTKKIRWNDWDKKYFINDPEPTDLFLKDTAEKTKDEPFVEKMITYKRYLIAYFIALVAENEAYAMPPAAGIGAAISNFINDPMASTGGKGKFLKIHFKKEELKEEKLNSAYHWQQFVANMRKYQPILGRMAFDALVSPFQTALQLNQELTDHTDKHYKNIWQQINDREVWADRKDGLILLSDRKDTTIAFDNGSWSASRKENRGNWDYLTTYLLRGLKK